MNIDTYLYPLDVTGRASTNKVVNERQTLNPPGEALDFHFILPMATPYYRDSMKLVHITTGRALVRGIDWMPGHKFQAASFELENAYGGVYASILFLDRTLSGQVQLAEYQTLGGTWTLNEPRILEILSNRMVDPRSLTFDEVSDKPTVFPPVDHNHPVDDFTGMAEMIEATNDVAAAIRQRTEDWLENPPLLFGEYYNKTAVDTKFNGVSVKFKLYYTAAEVDAKLQAMELGQASGDFYTKTEVNQLVGQVLDGFSGYYTKVQLDVKFDGIALEFDASDAALHELSVAFDNHRTSKQNPHGTTPLEIGAVEDSQYQIDQSVINASLMSLTSNKLNVSTYTAGIQAINSALNTLSTGKADKTEIGTNGRRDIYISTAAPSAGVGKIGDIWYQY